MKRLDIPERNDRIVALYNAGAKPSDIARKVKLGTRMVRVVLDERGIDASEPLYANDIAEEWQEDDEDRRRALIIRRAADGARQRLAELSASPNQDN